MSILNMYFLLVDEEEHLVEIVTDFLEKSDIIDYSAVCLSTVTKSFLFASSFSIFVLFCVELLH